MPFWRRKFDRLLRWRARRRLQQLSANPTFCTLPWLHAAVFATGKVFPCCESTKTIGQIRVQEGSPGLNEILHSEAMNKIRQGMLKGKRIEGCQRCYDVEDSGGISLRQISREWLPRVNLKNPHLGYVQMDLETTCNLTCRTCSSDSSSKWVQEEKKLKREHIYETRKSYAVKDLKIDFTPLFKVRILGGEPMMIKDLKNLNEKITAECDLKDLTLEYSINLTIFPNEETLDLWRKVKGVTLCVSIDGYGPLNDYIRRGSRWNEIVTNLDRLHLFFKTELTTESSLVVHTTVNIYNVRQLAVLDTWLLERYPNIALSKLCLTWPSEQNVVNLPQHLKDEAVQRLKQHPERAQYNYIANYIQRPANTPWPEVRRCHMEIQNLWNDSLKSIDPELCAALDEPVARELSLLTGEGLNAFQG